VDKVEGNGTKGDEEVGEGDGEFDEDFDEADEEETEVSDVGAFYET
jgi:hypothetical protein